MTRKFAYPLILAVACVLFVAVTLSVCLSPNVAGADPTPTYAVATITFDKAAYVGSGYNVKASVWTSTDKSQWQVGSLAALDASIVYYNGETLLAARPTEVGTYTAKVVLGAACPQGLQNAAGTALTEGSVLASLSYRVVDKGVSVVFAPASDINYNSAVNSHDAIVAGTKVYLDGEDVTASAAIKVQDGAFADTDTVTDPGEYHVVVEYAAKQYVSTFYVRRAIADVISLGGAVLYEGMYTSYNRGAADPAAARATMLANRTAYYTPKFTGSLAKADGSIKDAYAAQVAISYHEGSRRLSEVPTTAGDYVCRVTVTAAIADYDLKAGDYVDLPYTIKATPYSVVWNKSLDSALGAMYIVTDPNGISVRPTAFVLSADSTRNVELSVGNATYFDADGQEIAAADVADGLTEVGQYSVLYSIDLSHADGGKITGRDYFGEADATFSITADNCWVTCDFEIIGTYEVNGVRNVYYNDATAFAQSYIQTYNATHAAKMYAVDSLAPVVRYNSVAYEGLTVAYTYNGSDTFLDGDPVNLTNIRSKKAVGHYEATMTFGNWVGVNGNGQNVQVAKEGDTLHFAFDIVTVPHDDLLATADDAAGAEEAVQAVLSDLGLTNAQVTIGYYRLTNGLNSQIAASAMCGEVGTYAAAITANEGEYSGQTFVLTITKQSTATTDSIVFDFAGINGTSTDYSGTAVVASVDFGNESLANTLQYSLYYEAQVGGVWQVCSYPVAPGTYRAVLRFNEPCVYYSVGYGTTITRQFTIRSISLSADVRFAGDDVYDGSGKAVDVTFYAAGRPLSDEDVADFHYDVYFAKASDAEPTYSTELPLHADLYAVGIVFTAGDYNRYGYNATALTPAEIWVANGNSYAGYLLRTDNNLTLNKLLLDAVVTIPVGYHAMYTGDQILPTVAFYKGNGAEEEVADVDRIAALPALNEYVTGYNLYFNTQSSRTAFGANIKVEDTDPVETGKYDRLISLRESYVGDIAFSRIAVAYDGAVEGMSYAVSADVVAESNGEKLNIAYSVNALPVRVSVLENCFRLQGGTYVAYYGEAHMRATADLVFYTVNRDGDEVLLSTPDLKEYVTLQCYKRESGNDLLSGVISTAAGELLDKGSYTMRVAFAAPADDSVARTYGRYSLVGGTATAAEGLLKEGCYYDVPFDVLQAESMRVVFDPRFDSYTYDGNAKEFNVRFVSGEEDVSADFVRNVDYRVTYGDAENSNAIGSEDEDMSYNIKVTFLTGNYHYYVEQYVGVYSDEAENIRYIRAGSTVTYTFVVTRLRYLSWAWNKDEADASFYYNGTAIEHKVGFVSNTTYDPKAATVSLVKGTDYDVWYYAVDNETYTKLLKAPTAPGTYLAELVFLHDLTDYRYRMDSTDLVVYAYTNADSRFVPGSVVGSAGYYYGRSLTSSGVVLNNENRYYRYTIERPTLRVTSLSAIGKVFDNTDAATVANPYRLTALDGATIVEADVAGLRALLAENFAGQFENVGVGEAKTVYYRLHLGEGVWLTMPHSALCAALGKTGKQFVSEQLAAISTAALSEETKNTVDNVQSTFDRLFNYYELYFDDVTADITKGTITVIANNYSRRYDPEFDDTGVLTYTLSAADLTKLQSLMAAADATAYFVGSLSRENADVAAINENGYAIVAGPDFGFVDTVITLSDGSVCTLADLFNLRINRAYYYITPYPISVGVEGNLVTAVYGDPDPTISYKVVSGALRDGDTLVYVGQADEQRTHVKEIDDVGTYAVLYNQLRIMRFGLDVTANYRISYRAAEFVITPMEVILTPLFEKAAYYERDAFVPTDVGVSKRVGGNVVGFNDLQSRFHATIDYTFGRVEVASTDPKVYKCYNVTLGAIKVTGEDGTDLSDNFTYSLGVDTKQFVVNKYNVRLGLVVGDVDPYKYFGDPDPHVQLVDYNNSLAGYRFHLTQDSEPSREQGEEKGIYKFLSGNESGNIHVLDEEENEVTKFCNIEVYKDGSSQLIGNSDVTFNINEMNVTVTVRSETVYRTGRSILPEVIYLTRDGTAVSSALISQMKCKYVIPAGWEMQEGDNLITPVLVSEQEDPNFIYTTVPGKVHVVYPNNMVSVDALAQDDSTAAANRYVFVGSTLYRTLQIYAANTMNGEDPNRDVEVTLPVTEALYGEDVYIVAVRRDGTYAVLDAAVEGTQIIINFPEGDQFYYYLMAAQPEKWPTYVVIGVAVLLVVAVLVAVLRSRKRVKVRGKKERPGKEKKPKKEKPAPAATVAPVTPQGDEYGLDDLPEEEGTGQDTAPEGEDAPEEGKGKKRKKEPKAPKPKAPKPKDKPKEKPKAAPKGSAKPTGYVPTMARPTAPEVSATDSDTLPIPPAEDTLSIPSDDTLGAVDTGVPAAGDDEIVLGGGTGGFGGMSQSVGSDDDEIVIATTSRRLADDDAPDDNE